MFRKNISEMWIFPHDVFCVQINHALTSLGAIHLGFLNGVKRPTCVHPLRILHIKYHHIYVVSFCDLTQKQNIFLSYYLLNGNNCLTN